MRNIRKFESKNGKIVLMEVFTDGHTDTYKSHAYLEPQKFESMLEDNKKLKEKYGEKFMIECIYAGEKHVAKFGIAKRHYPALQYR